jgi:hypothetical protein
VVDQTQKGGGALVRSPSRVLELIQGVAVGACPLAAAAA